MRPRNFHVAVAMRLGLPVLDEEKSCSLCMQTIDVFGDHAACCSMSSDRIHRHNRVRNLLDRICQEGMLAPVMEKKRLLGDVYGRRPGDVRFQSGVRTKALPLTWRLPALLPRPICISPNHASLMQPGRNMHIMTMTSRAQPSSLQPWCSRQLEVSTSKVWKSCVNCSASQPSTKAFN